MIDVETQLQEYGEFHEQEWGPLTAEDMLAGFVSATSPKKHSARRLSSTAIRFTIGVSAAAVTVLLLGLIPLLVNQTNPEEDKTSAETLAESTMTPPAVSVAEGWTQIPHDETIFGGAGMSSVTAGGPGLVAVGGANDDAAVWTSADGLTWSRVPHDDALFGGADIKKVLVWRSGLAAVGHDDGGIAVWTSPDGITWSPVPRDISVFGEARINDVIAWGPSLIAVGNFGDDAAVWTSADGITWSRAPHVEAVFGGGDNQAMLAVTTGGPGLVAVGYDGRGEEGYSQGLDAAVWTSADGIRWSRAPNDESVFGGLSYSVMEDVTVGGPGLVAVGHEASGPVVWTSVDGVIWSRVRPDTTISGGIMAAVSTGGPGLVAIGEDTRPGWNGGLRALVWTSADGISWTRVPHDESAFGEVGMADLISTEFGLVAIGNRNREMRSTDAAAVLIWED